MLDRHGGFASIAMRGHVKGGVVVSQPQTVTPFVGGHDRAVGIAGVDREPESCFGCSGISVFGVVVEVGKDLKYLTFSVQTVFPGAHAR